MGFAILRTQKLKSGYAVNRSLKHAFREQVTPNADETKRGLNKSIFTDTRQQAMDRFNALLPEKRRKNAVLAIEYLMTASPEDMQGKTREQQLAYFADCVEWLKEKHGEQNIVNVGIHFDETTPHLYAYVVPIDERGKLNCRSFLGGAKALSDMQSDFAERVGKKHGLERGIQGSKAKHQRISQFYANINKNKPNLSLDDLEQKKTGMLSKEPLEAVRDRVDQKITAILDHKTAETEKLKKRLAEVERENEKLRLERNINAFKRENEKIQGKVQENQKKRPMSVSGGIKNS